MNWRTVARGAVALFVLAAAAGAASADTYPTGPVRVIVPFPPGGPLDVLGRALGEAFRAKTGQSFVIDNKPGANTALGAVNCKNAAPDGYTICMLTVSTISLNPFLYSKLAYDPMTDLTPITNMVVVRQALILHNSVPAKNLAELVEYSKQNPDKLNYGSFGTGGAAHLMVEWVKNKTGLKITHVPFGGAPPALLAFERGDIQLLNPVPTPPVIEKVRSGQAKAILVLGKRNPDLPDVPIETEVGLPALKFDNWFGAFAPAGTPADRVELLNKIMADALKDPAFQDKYIQRNGFDPVGDSVAEFQKALVGYRDQAQELVRISGAKLD